MLITSSPMNKLIFYESQNMRKHWAFYLSIVISVGVCSLSLIYPVGRVLPPILISLATTLILYFIKFKTKINEDGIYIKYFPFQLKGRLWRWSEIQSFRAAHFDPLSQFGGWGIRVSLNGNRCYSAKGSFAFILSVRNKNIYIGTQKKDQAAEVIEKTSSMRLKSINLNESDRKREAMRGT